jgi:anti-sigma factor RsiW
MTECCKQGELRAYLDRELPQQEMKQIAAHLEGCPACSASFDAIAARARRVSASLGDLAAVPSIRAVPARESHAWRWAAAGAVLAAAAGLAALALLPSHKAPVTAVHRTATSAPVVEVANAVNPPQVERPHAPPAVHHRRKPRPAAPEYFMALDNEPIDTGVVMRVALESGMEADVIVDSEGHPRAIRPVSFTK